MCQWCKRPVQDERAASSSVYVYCGKLFHRLCFAKLRRVAWRTGGQL